jgi:ribosome biogenesis GTPase
MTVRALLMALLLACAHAHAATVTDDRGVAVTLAQPPQRIVTLMPALAEMVCELGACARLVGVDDFANWPEAVRRLPHVGGLEDASIETIVALRPDVVQIPVSSRALGRREGLGLRVVALNKSDLVEPFEKAWGRLLPYQRMGYGVLPLSLRLSKDVDKAELLKHLQGKTTLVLGPSGAGKSTLINLLVPGALVVTGEVSQALNSGKHTTTSTTLYWVDPERTTALIDSPGFQEFGLNHIEPTQLAACMPDLRPHIGNCKFYNCTHLHEPGCAVLGAIDSPDNPHPVTKRRHQIYNELFAELSQPERY